MKSCFADTFYFLAMLNPDDEAHDKAMAVAASLRRGLVTTSWVLTEVGDALATTANRPLFGTLLSRLRADARATIVPTTDDLFGRGVDFNIDRPDKGWSLTDCISFVVMEELGITDALTADHHFEQAGFVTMLR